MFDFNKWIWDSNTKPEHARSPSFNQICLLQYWWTGEIPWLSALKEYIKRKRNCDQWFFFLLFCFTSSLCHGFCFTPLGHTSLCIFTVTFWFSDYAIFSEEVRLLNQGKKESFENLEIPVLIFMKYQREKLQHLCQFWPYDPLAPWNISPHWRDQGNIPAIDKTFSLITERTFKILSWKTVPCFRHFFHKGW